MKTSPSRGAWRVPLLAVLGVVAVAAPILWNASAASRARSHRDAGMDLLHGYRAADALTELTEAVHENPRDADALYDRAEALAALHRGTESAAALRKAGALAPRNAAIWLALGQMDSEIPLQHEAVSALEQYVRLEPEDPQGWILLAGALAQDNQSNAAAAAAGRAIELNPAEAGTYLLKADQEALAGAPASQVEKDAHAGIERRPDFALGYYLAGRAELAEGKLTAALDDLNHAVLLSRRTRDRASYLYLRGRARAALGQQGGAARDFAESRQITLKSPPGVHIP